MVTTVQYTDTFLSMLNDLEADGRYGIMDDEDEFGNFIFSTNFTTWVFSYADIFRVWAELQL